MAYGFNGFIGLAKETTWGSGTAATDFVEALSENVTVTMDRFSHKAMIGTSAEPDDTAGLRKVAGNIVFAANPVAVGHFLKGALQSKSVTTVGSFLWTNTFISTQVGDDFSTDTPLQPYTLEIFRDVTSSHRYTGVCVDTLKFSIETNNAVMCEAGLVGRGNAIIAKSTSNPTFPSSPAKPFTFDTVSLSVAGAGTVLIESMDITINNNLQGFGALNQSFDIAKIRRGNHQMVTLSGTLDFTNVNEYLNFINQTTQAFVVSVTKANSFQMVISLPQVVYTAFPLGVSGRDRITVSFEGKAQYNTGSGHAIRVQLTTTNSAY